MCDLITGCVSPSRGASAPIAGCQCSPSLGIFVSLTGYLCPLSGSARLRHREPLTTRFPPRGSFPRVPPSLCSGASGFVPSVCRRGAVLSAPGGRRRLVLPAPSLPPPGTSKLSLRRELRCIRGAQGRLEAPGFSQSPPALWDTCDLFVLCFILFATFPSFSTERASREIPGEYPFKGLAPERLRARARGKMNN